MRTRAPVRRRVASNIRSKAGPVEKVRIARAQDPLGQQLQKPRSPPAATRPARRKERPAGSRPWGAAARREAIGTAWRTLRAATQDVGGGGGGGGGGI